MKKKVYVVGSSRNYSRFMSEVDIVSKIDDADIVLFTGGEDVTPDLYGKKAHRKSYFNLARDKEETSVFKKIRKDQLALGICRGSQFLCVMNGGILVQDCNNHACWGTHTIIGNEGDVFDITSTHHQMQYPYDINPEYYKVLYKSENNRCSYYEGDGVNSEVLKENGEPEIVLYNNPDLPVCLAVQGHPEMMPGSPVANRIDEIIESLLKTKI